MALKDILFLFLFCLMVMSLTMAIAFALKIVDTGRRARYARGSHIRFVKLFYLTLIVMVSLIEGMIQAKIETKRPGLQGLIEGILKLLDNPLGMVHAVLIVLFTLTSLHNLFRNGFKSPLLHRYTGRFIIADFFAIAFTGGLLLINLVLR